MVYMLLGTGFEEAEALVPVDLLRRADIPVCLAGVDGRVITGAHGISVTADCPVSEVTREELEMAVLPGGLGGVAAIRASAEAMDLIRWSCDNGVRLAAICAAPTILSDLGMLDGRRAVCYPSLLDKLSNTLPCDDAVAVDGPFITAQAAGCAFEFGFKLIEVLRGAEAAEQVSRAIYFNR